MIHENNFSISDYSDILKRRKWAFIIPFLLVLVIATAVSLLLSPVYKSTSTILIEEQEIPVDYVRSTVTTYADQRLQVITQRIMSATRLQEIIDRFELYADLTEKKSKEEIVEIMREDIHLETVSVDVMDRNTGRPTSATIAFTLSYEGKNDPVKVQRVANVLASFYLEENLKVRERQVNEASKFFEDELRKVKENLTGLEDKIARFKEGHVDALPELLPVLMQNKHNVDMSLNRLSEQLRNLKERESILLADLATTPSEFDHEKNELESLKIQLAEMQTIFTDAYPEVKKLRGTIAGLEKKRQNAIHPEDKKKETPDNPAYISLASQLAGVQSEIESVQGQYVDLEKEKGEIDGRIAFIPANERKYSVLENERRNSQRKYDDLMAKFMEAKVAQGLEKDQKGERFTLIDPPIIAEKPYKPNRLAIMLIGFVLAFGSGIGFGALREFSDDAVRNLERLQQIAGVGILAVIPEIITPSEARNQKRKKFMTILFVVAVLVSAGFAFQLFVMDYQILWIKLMRRLG